MLVIVMVNLIKEINANKNLIRFYSFSYYFLSLSFSIVLRGYAFKSFYIPLFLLFSHLFLLKHTNSVVMIILAPPVFFTLKILITHVNVLSTATEKSYFFSK